jgi:hypothetical protein
MRARSDWYRGTHVRGLELIGARSRQISRARVFYYPFIPSKNIKFVVRHEAHLGIDHVRVFLQHNWTIPTDSSFKSWPSLMNGDKPGPLRKKLVLVGDNGVGKW